MSSSERKLHCAVSWETPAKPISVIMPSSDEVHEITHKLYDQDKLIQLAANTAIDSDTGRPKALEICTHMPLAMMLEAYRGYPAPFLSAISEIRYAINEQAAIKKLPNTNKFTEFYNKHFSTFKPAPTNSKNKKVEPKLANKLSVK